MDDQNKRQLATSGAMRVAFASLADDRRTA
jgi:hypothetical protein